MAIGIIEFLNKQNGVPRSLEQLRMFRSESQYMCEYLIRALGSFHCGCSRINFWYTDGDLDPKIHEYFRIIDMDVPFDFRYCSMSPDEKKEYMFQLLTSSLRALCERKEWDFAIFKKHLDALEENHYNVEFYVKNKICRNGKYTAKVFSVHDLDKAEFFVDFIEKRKVIQRKPLLTCGTSWADYPRFLGEFKWIDEKTVALYAKYGDKVFYASMDD